MDSKTKWNKKYEIRINNEEQNGPNPRLQSLSPFLLGGRALDIACGLGGNSLYLSKIGYQVEAYDISDVAIHYLQEQAQTRKLPVHAHVHDLTDWNNLKLKPFDLIVITYYLDRSIFPFIQRLLADNGFLFVETFYKSPLTKVEGVSVSDQFKLQPGELLKVFGDMKVLYFEENEQESRQTILVRNKNLQH